MATAPRRKFLRKYERMKVDVRRTIKKALTNVGPGLNLVHACTSMQESPLYETTFSNASPL